MIEGRHDTYLTPEELAQMARVAPKTVRNWLCQGMVRAVRLGRRRFITLSSIEEAFGHSRNALVPLPRSLEKRMRFVLGDVRGAGDDESGAEDEAPA